MKLLKPQVDGNLSVWAFCSQADFESDILIDCSNSTCSSVRSICKSVRIYFKRLRSEDLYAAFFSSSSCLFLQLILAFCYSHKNAVQLPTCMVHLLTLYVYLSLAQSFSVFLCVSLSFYHFFLFLFNPFLCP